MATQNPWRDARNAKGWTLDIAIHEWLNRDMSPTIKRELNRAKLSRFELGKNTTLTPFAKAHLADLYGLLLSTLDEDAAQQYRELTQAAPISTWKTTSATHVAA